MLEAKAQARSARPQNNADWRQGALYFAAILYTFAIYGPMAVMSMGAGIAFAIWLATRFDRLGADLQKFTRLPMFWPTVALGLAGLWSLVWAKLSGLTYRGMQPHIDWVGDLKKAWHLVHPFVLAPVFAALPAKKLKRVFKLWLVLGVATAIFGIVQYYVPLYHAVPLPHVLRGEQHKGTGLFSFLYGSYHATGFTGFHLSYATIIAFPASVCLALLAVLQRRQPGISRRTLVVAGACALFFVASILTYSKTAWAAMPLTVLLIALIGFKGRTRWALVALVVAVTIGWGSSSEVRTRFLGAERTTADRLGLWSANFDMIKQFPIFGVGWHHNAELTEVYYRDNDLHTLQSHAHNNLIDQWSTTGLVGLLAFLWWNIAAVVVAFRIYRASHDLFWRSLGLGLIGGWFCLHLNGMTQANWWDAKVLHQIAWVTALSMEAYRRQALSGE